MFWINETLGVAAERTEAGFMCFDKESDDFIEPMSPELREKFFKTGCKVSDADEAKAFARSHLAVDTPV